MNAEQALKILKEFYKWRIGVEGINMTKPSMTTEALNTAIRIMEQLPKTIETAFDEGHLTGTEGIDMNGREYYKSLIT